MQFSKQRIFISAGIVLLGAILFFVFSARPVAAPVLESPLATTTATSSVPASNTETSQTQPVVANPKGNTTPTTAAPVPTVKATSALGRSAPELVRPTGYSNIDTLGIVSTEQFTLRRYMGQKVILLEFWTTSSLTSLHTIPYLNYWYNTYKDDGLMVVGVHAPQFSFERSKTVVDQVIFSRQIHFPVVIDNEYSTWTAYKNTVWPHRYVIDMSGKIVYEHSGDGAYEATQAKIMELLSARAKKLGGSFTVGKFETPKDAFSTDTAQVGSSDAYFGSAKNKNLSGGISNREGVQVFEPQTDVALNKIALSGSWNFTKEYAQNMTENTAILYRYRAKDVFATLAAEKITKMTLLLDGKPLSVSDAGADVVFEKGESVSYVKDARVYHLVTNPSGYGEHVLSLIPENGGLHVFSLMFQ